MQRSDRQQELSSSVEMREELITIPTYISLPPDQYPMFLEKRVYQGSSGSVYPIPFTDRVSDEKADVAYRAVRLENEFIQVVLLPQFGGRIYAGLDKTNGYDFVYRNAVIKPALVGLAGPWLSGGIEFNWPQHHRPATFQPVDYILDEYEDGSKTVWLSEIEPFNHMKGMAGVTLHPGKSYLEVKVQLYNRTPFPQTFLWWANLAVPVNDAYQAIFPPDVHFVVDHAKRAVSRFPIADGQYYGVDYSRGVDISWFRNIPVPTSYMALGSRYDFLGGYDHGKQAGVVHVADHHISPGKKMWTWGAGDFGRVWYENLTDEDGPYIELMTGVYTDNQPDFSWLHPHETRTFSQYWYPIRNLGSIKQATLDAAINLEEREQSTWIGVNTTARFSAAIVVLEDARGALWQETADIAPDAPFTTELSLRSSEYVPPLSLSVWASGGKELARYTLEPSEESTVPPPATPAPAPEDIETIESLYLTGLHLEQYRHATYSPQPYYEEALRRDPGDVRANNALGLLYLRRGCFQEAAEHFRRAIARLTMKNPNPYDGEPFYNLGLALRFMGKDDDAYHALYKATWNYPWQSPAYYALAELDCRGGRFACALDHVDRSLRANALDTKARNLRVAVLRRLGSLAEAQETAHRTVDIDILDFWSRNELYRIEVQRGSQEAADRRRGELRALMRDNAESYLDLASDYGGAGLWDEAIDVLSWLASSGDSASPLVFYYLGYYAHRQGDQESALHYYRRAAEVNPDYCFPNRLDTIAVLRHAMERNPQDARAPYYLGNLFYDKKRYDEAIGLWERSRDIDARFPIVHRNLGLAYYNIERGPEKARRAFQQAFKVDVQNARLLYELDQLEKRVGASPEERLARLEAHLDLVEQRDDLYLELVTLSIQCGRYDAAVKLLESRHFHPWEGGEGKVTRAYVHAHLLRGKDCLERGEPQKALQDFLAALTYPANLGEGKHEVLTSDADVLYHVGLAYQALGDTERAGDAYRRAAEETDPEQLYYRGLALRRLGRDREADETFRALITRGNERLQAGARIDYFATSLPTFLIFEDDPAAHNAADAHVLRGLGYLGLEQARDAETEFATVLDLNRNHPSLSLLPPSCREPGSAARR